MKWQSNFDPDKTGQQSLPEGLRNLTLREEDYFVMPIPNHPGRFNSMFFSRDQAVIVSWQACFSYCGPDIGLKAVDPTGYRLDGLPPSAENQNRAYIYWPNLETAEGARVVLIVDINGAPQELLFNSPNALCPNCAEGRMFVTDLFGKVVCDDYYDDYYK